MPAGVPPPASRRPLPQPPCRERSPGGWPPATPSRAASISGCGLCRPRETSMTDPQAITLRPARRTDLPAIVRLLADDHLGRGRERLEEPLPASYEAAFDAIAK